MKLVFEDNVSGTVMEFPHVGPWKSGEVKDIPRGKAEFLLAHHGAQIKRYQPKFVKPVEEPPKESPPESQVEEGRQE